MESSRKGKGQSTRRVFHAHALLSGLYARLHIDTLPQSARFPPVSQIYLDDGQRAVCSAHVGQLVCGELCPGMCDRGQCRPLF